MDPDVNSKHKGETRETRINEFLAQNETVVIGLREGTCIRVDGNVAKLLGDINARIFSK